MLDKLQGMGVALVTPLNNDGSIDYVGLERLLNFQIENGTNFLVSLGTTGETATLSDAERYEILNFTLGVCDDRVPVIAGYGGNDTAHVIRALTEFPPDAFHSILSVCPYYNRPNQEGIYQHYAAIAEACPVPIILYNVPSRTGTNISSDTTLRLAHDFDNIVAMKEASGNMEQCMEILAGAPPDFSVISGEDLLTFPLMALGFDGVISVVGNAYPKMFGSMITDCLEGNWDTAQEAHFHLMRMNQLIFRDGNPGGIKAALKVLGICEDHLRLPLSNINDKLYNEIAKEVARLKQTSELVDS